MSYPIIQPPFTLVFREMSKKELKDYNEWFHKVMPERIQILTFAVKSTPGYENWEPDYSPESLEPLGEWFFAQVETRPRTSEEIDAIQNQSKFPINIPGEDLTNKTFSLAMDIGMYVSQVFLKHHPALEWSHPFGNKKSVDYGQPVLISFGASPFNPVHMMVTLAYGFSRKSKTGGRLRELYNIWSNLASAAVA
jgi:hypothetical protein